MPRGWSVPSLEIRHISCFLPPSLLPETGQRARIFISEMIASIKISGNRLVHIIGLDSSTMLTKPCPQSSSSLPNIKHASSTAGDAIDEMGGGARK